MSRYLSKFSFLLVFGALVEVSSKKRVKITNKNSQTGGKTNGSQLSSNQRVLSSITSSIFQTQSLRTGVKWPHLM
jgi:hypothetical protein